MLEPASTNPKGHFEDLEILNIHRDDLISRNLDPSGLFCDQPIFDLSESLQSRADEFLRSRVKYDLWGWKEPRTSLYLSFWKKRIGTLRVIVLERDPELVTNSLYKRLRKNKMTELAKRTVAFKHWRWRLRHE